MTEQEYRRRMREAGEAYRRYRQAGGDMDAHRWFACYADTELFNEWHGRNMRSSYGVSLRGLTYADGVRVTRGF